MRRSRPSTGWVHHILDSPRGLSHPPTTTLKHTRRQTPGYPIGPPPIKSWPSIWAPLGTLLLHNIDDGLFCGAQCVDDAVRVYWALCTMKSAAPFRYSRIDNQPHGICTESQRLPCTCGLPTQLRRLLQVKQQS